jgi:hypothetical protein
MRQEALERLSQKVSGPLPASLGLQVETICKNQSNGLLAYPDLNNSEIALLISRSGSLI